MKRFVGVFILLLSLFSGPCWGQDFKWDSDTMWFVNTSYRANPEYMYKFTLKLPATGRPADHNFARVYWGAGASGPVKNITTDQTLTHEYKNGSFELKVELFKSDPTGNMDAVADTVFTDMVFNKGLNVDFKIESIDRNFPDNKGCMEHGLDTFLLEVPGTGNPPGTEYTIKVESKAPWIPGVSADSAVVRYINEQKDSAYLIFRAPTGTHGADISVDATYTVSEEEELFTNARGSQKVFVYKSPDLARIFSFTDTVVTGARIENFKVCTGLATSGNNGNGNLNELFYNADVNKMYMDELKQPNYLKFERRLPYFEMTIYRSDTISENISEIPWKEVHDVEIVDTTSGKIQFNKGGFYKIKMVAYNVCSTVGGILTRDTLKTEVVKDSLRERYIQVSEGNIASLFCRTDTLCLGETGSWAEAVFVDTNRRMMYDPVPTYEFTALNRSVDGEQQSGDNVTIGYGRPITTIYKNSEKYSYTGEISGEEKNKWDKKGCDSTVIKIKYTLPGTYKMGLEKKVEGGCGAATRELAITIGRPMEMTQDTLLKLWRKEAETNIHGDTIETCGVYEYSLPDVGIKNGNWGGNMNTDSVMWHFTRGTQKDTIMLAGQAGDVISFDSTSNRINIIRIKAHNYCGWSGADSVKFYTRTIPNVTLWRDSVENNDTLCVKVPYTYYLHGSLPENFTDSIYFSKKIKIGTKTDVEVYKGDTSKIEGITYLQEGKMVEKFVIINADNKNCLQRFSDTVFAVAQPVSPNLGDTTLYCDSERILNGKNVFADPDDVAQMKIKWIWNGTPANDYEHLQYKKNGSDTLLVITKSKGGCKLERKLIFIPKAKPDLKLPASDTICVINPVTLKQAEYERYVANSNWVKSMMQLQIFKNRKQTGDLLYNSYLLDETKALTLKNTDQADTVRLIYNLEYDYEICDIWGQGCSQTDTLLLLIEKPKIVISKKDTLQQPFESYAFSRLTGKIDTADVVPGTLAWKLDGRQISTELYTKVYTLEESDKAKDSLVFELSAKTACGEVVSDSLIVYIPKVRLYGGTDTICNNVAYTLWGGMATGEFVDKSSLTWQLVKWGSDRIGTLSAAGGESVTYTPNATVRDSVKIAFSAHGVMNDVRVDDTLYLKINPAPVSNLKDTLIAKDRKMSCTLIDSWRDMIKNGTLASTHGKVNNALGDWDANTYIMGTRPAGSENYSEKIWIGMDGLPGCATLKDTLTLLEVVAPEIVFNAQVEMCSQAKIDLSTTYTVKEKDKYTVLSWTLEGGGGALAEPDYTSGEQDAQLKLTARKTFQYYNESATREVFSVAKPKVIVVHPKPVITITPDRDTICYSKDTVTIARSHIAVQPERYKDSLSYHGIGLTGTFPHYTFKGAAEETAKFVVNVKQGVCEKWKDKSDTLYLYKLPEMDGSFNIDPVLLCENQTAQVKDLSITPALGSYFWTATGGTLNRTDNHPTPTFTPTRGNKEGNVILHIVPPRACTAADTVIKTATSGKIEVAALPDIELKDTTICATVSITNIAFKPQERITKISWYVQGNQQPFKVLNDGLAGFVQYQVKPEDVAKDSIKIIARIEPNIPCNETPAYEDTLTLKFQKIPVINVPNDPTVCQGVTFDLFTEVPTTNFESIVWEIKSGGGSLESTSSAFKFIPYDGADGPTGLSVRATGLHGCPPTDANMTLTVLRAPVPPIMSDFPVCQYGEIAFNTTETTGKAYSWSFGDGRIATGQSQKHVYSEAGNKTVVLTATYPNGCTRPNTKVITVNEKPQADFTFESPAAVGTPVLFTNTSTLAATSEWIFGDGLPGCNTENCSHIFSQPSEGTDITLVVTSLAGCKDTAGPKSIIVVPVPVPNFTPTWDPCVGEVALNNSSELHHATVAWDFGDGTGSSDENQASHTYQRYWTDTTFTITLTLTNAAGTRTMEKPIRLASEIKAGLKILQDPVGCHSVKKKVKNLSQGKADWYEIHWGDGSDSLHLTSFSVYPEEHVYKNETNVIKHYKVWMMAHNECKTDTAEMPTEIHPISVLAMIGIDTAYKNECFGHTRGFVNYSLGFGGIGFNCEWTFEPNLDFVRDNATKVTHDFRSPGNYVVKLKINDNCNESSDTALIRVRGNDSLDFKIQQGPHCAGQEIKMEFVQKGVREFGGFKWHFSDGHVQDGKTTRYTFDAPGKQQITLKATAEGCPSEVTHEIAMVNESPVAMISVGNNLKSGCEPFEVKFRANGGEALGASVLWDFKNEAFSDKREETNLFRHSGIYPVVLKLTTPEGCVDTAMVDITVKHTPVINFSVNDSLFCTKTGSFTVALDNISPDMDISSFSWWKQGERFSIEKQPGHLNFSDVHGPIELKLMAVHQENGCQSEVIKTIVASTQVTAKIGMDRDELCLEVPVHFTNDSENGNHLTWNLGDGTISGESAFDHIYDEIGSYTISLVAWNEDGCVDSMVRQMIVYPLPTADFTFEKDNSITGLSDTLELPELDNGGIRFRNLSYVSPQTWGNEMTAYWDFKDGKSSVEWAPYHKFDSNGIYNILLRVTTKQGCVDSVVSAEAVAIKTIKGLFIPTAFAPAQADEGVNRFKPVGVGLHRYKIQVYDFRGTCVWSSTKLENGGRPAEWWDGLFNGAPAPKGNYLWKASGVFIDGSVWEGDRGATEGSVMLIR